MERLTVIEAANRLGISKEAVYNRIRRNTIQSEEIDGVKYIIFNNDDKKSSKEEKEAKPKNTSQNKNNDEFVKYLMQEIEYLKEKNKILQEDKEKLYKEKEEILISSKEEIKQMYKERDEKLQYFLSLFEKPLINKNNVIDVSDLHFSNINDESENEDQWLAMLEFLQILDYKKKKRKKIKKLLINNIGKSDYIKIENGVLLINTKLNLKELRNSKFGDKK